MTANSSLESILEKLDPADRAIVEAALPSPAQAAIRTRRATRDEAIRDAAPLFDGNPATLSRELAKYLVQAWPRERALKTLPLTASARRRALHRIEGIDDWPLSSKQIGRIFRARTAIIMDICFVHGPRANRNS